MPPFGCCAWGWDRHRCTGLCSGPISSSLVHRGVELLGHKAILCFVFEDLPNTSHSNCNILRSHQQSRRVPFSISEACHLLAFVLATLAAWSRSSLGLWFARPQCRVPSPALVAFGCPLRSCKSFARLTGMFPLWSFRGSTVVLGVFSILKLSAMICKYFLPLVGYHFTLIMSLDACKFNFGEVQFICPGGDLLLVFLVLCLLQSLFYFFNLFSLFTPLRFLQLLYHHKLNYWITLE